MKPESAWQALGFSIDGEHDCRYEYVSRGRGAEGEFTARAIGDLDCDGILSTFERMGFVEPREDTNGLFMHQVLE